MWKRPSGTESDVHCNDWTEVGAIIDRIRSKIADKGLQLQAVRLQGHSKTALNKPCTLGFKSLQAQFQAAGVRAEGAKYYTHWPRSWERPGWQIEVTKDNITETILECNLQNDSVVL
eukprot:6706135-Prorocentrum_lima.AAC.1